MSVAALALLLFVSLPARAQQAPQKIDVTRLGPQAYPASEIYHFKCANVVLARIWL